MIGVVVYFYKKIGFSWLLQLVVYDLFPIGWGRFFSFNVSKQQVKSEGWGLWAYVYASIFPSF